MSGTPVVAFDSVNYTYRGDWLQRITALTDVNFTVPSGSAFGYLGANGAGKSTSIKLLMGLLHGHTGSIRLFDQPIGKPSLRQAVGYLPEHPFFYDNLAVDEYLTYLARLSRMPAGEIEASKERVYEILDLGELRQRRLRSFSKGMRQRFGLAQAILHRPKLLVLDEPFSGLDPLWRGRFREILQAQKRAGTTLFFSSHILSDVEDLCDEFVVIDHGRIIVQDTMESLFAQAPLVLTASGPLIAGAQQDEDSEHWSITFPESEREATVAQVLAAGGQIIRIERPRQALEDYFVERVREFHAAGTAMSEESKT